MNDGRAWCVACLIWGRAMAHEIDRLINEIKWALNDRVDQARGAINQVQDAAGEQWASMMIRNYATNHKMSEKQARTALVLLGVAVAFKAENKTPPTPTSERVRKALGIALRVISVAI